MHWGDYNTQSKASCRLKRQEIDRVKTSDWFLHRTSITPLIWPRFQWTIHPATLEQGWGKRTPSSSRSNSNPRSLSISFSSWGRMTSSDLDLTFTGEIEWKSISVILKPAHCLYEHSLIERCCHLSGTSIPVTLLKLLEPTLNEMHCLVCVVSNKIDPSYIVCIKIYSTFFISSHPALASSRPGPLAQNYSKGANLSTLNRKIDFSIHLSTCSWPPLGVVMSKMPTHFLTHFIHTFSHSIKSVQNLLGRRFNRISLKMILGAVESKHLGDVLIRIRSWLDFTQEGFC